MTIAFYNTLTPATLLPLPADKTPLDYPTLTDQQLIPQINLQKTPLENAELIWITDWFLPKR